MPTTWSRRCSRSTAAKPSRRKIRCRPIGCAGSTSSAFTSFAAATSRRRRAGSTCIAARCSAFWPSARRSESLAACDYGGSRLSARPGMMADRFCCVETALRFQPVWRLWVGQRREAKRRRAGEGEHHALAGGGMQTMLGCLTEDRCAEAVRNDETDVRRKDLTRHLERGGEEQPVAMQPVIHPLLVRAQIRNRGLDLDDPHLPVAAERHE